MESEYQLKDYFLSTVLNRQDVERLLDDYYDERGWDKKTSVPAAPKLKELGLNHLKGIA